MKAASHAMQEFDAESGSHATPALPHFIALFSGPPPRGEKNTSQMLGSTWVRYCFPANCGRRVRGSNCLYWGPGSSETCHSCGSGANGISWVGPVEVWATHFKSFLEVFENGPSWKLCNRLLHVASLQQLNALQPIHDRNMLNYVEKFILQMRSLRSNFPGAPAAWRASLRRRAEAASMQTDFL